MTGTVGPFHLVECANLQWTEANKHHVFVTARLVKCPATEPNARQTGAVTLAGAAVENLGVVPPAAKGIGAIPPLHTSLQMGLLLLHPVRSLTTPSAFCFFITLGLQHPGAIPGFRRGGVITAE